MKAISFHITLEEPLLAPALSGDPNSATSYPFIPGSLIRGALATQYAQANPNVDLAHETSSRILFFNHTTCFLNAYPLISIDGAEARTLPVPLSWRREKAETPPQTVYDQSAKSASDLKQPATLSQSFCHLSNGSILLREPVRRFNVHTRRENRTMGRATEESGAVFRYEALAPGQIFGGVMLYEDDLATDLLSNETLLLGGSRTTGYGRVMLTVDTPQSDWREIGGNTQNVKPIPAGETFSLTLLSDLLLQDIHGQYTTTITSTILARWLGVTSITIKRAFKADSVIGGFNRKWGLPLIQTPVVRAGTVFVLEAEEDIPADRIINLEQNGVGKRRVEGLGRLAINWHGQQAKLPVIHPDKEKQPEQASTSAPQITGVDSRALAQTMYERLFRDRLDLLISQYVHHSAQLHPNGIKPSQPARLRVLVRHALSNKKDTLSGLLDWLNELRQASRKQFEAAKVGQESLMVWLQKRLEQPETIWQTLDIEPQEQPLATIKNGSDTADLKLANEITLRLVDGVLARLAKEAKTNE